MKKNIAVAVFLAFIATLAAHAQNLESVLNSMDKAAADFRTAQTEFVWTNTRKWWMSTICRRAPMYFRRQGEDVQMAADITVPDKKYVLFSGGMVSVYVPKAGQITEYNAGKSKADFETFLVLGFGGRGHDLARSFDVKYGGLEQVQGINAAKAGVDSKIAEGRQHVSDDHAVDRSGARVSVQQLFTEKSGTTGWRSTTIFNRTRKLSNDVFKLKTSGKVTYVRPNAQ